MEPTEFQFRVHADFLPPDFIITRRKAVDMFAYYIANLIRAYGCPGHCKDLPEQPFKSCRSCDSFNERRLLTCWFLVAFLNTTPPCALTQQDRFPGFDLSPAGKEPA